MKLNPPASSSDLDAARAVARRLHRHSRGYERATDEGPPAEATPAVSPVPAPGPAPEPSPVETTTPEPPPEVEAPAGEPDGSPDLADSQPILEPPPRTPETEAPAPWDETPEDAAVPNEIDPDAAFGDLGPSDGGPAEASDAVEGLEPPPEAASPEDLVGGEPAAGWPGETPFEVEIETDQEPERAPDDLVAAATPSWDDVADACLALAQAHGTMFVDSSGRVITARGEWPEPGPEAIGGRLVSMMERTLQDAPTRSVSAPLAGQNLTAWRVPAPDGFLTVVFMGDVPLGVDVRPSIDAEITQALGE